MKIRAFIDGAARGNPGPAGAGVYVEAERDRPVLEYWEPLGNTTNNVAEYRALLLGLRSALDLGVKRLEVRADSELLIKQLKGEYRVKNAGLRPLYEEALVLLRGLEEVRLKHVRREHNTEADRLANEGIDRGK